MNQPIQFTMPRSMINSRLDVVQLIGAGYNNSQISQITGHTRAFVRQTRRGLSNGTLFDQNAKIGRPTIRTPELINSIDSITLQNRRMPCNAIVDILKSRDDLPNASYGTVNSIRHNLNYKYLPPIHTFEITEQQRINRLSFANHHIQANTDWSKGIFVDESMFYLDNNHRWLWRRRGEFNEELVQHRTPKYIKKVMMFGGISTKWKTPLITIDQTVDSINYIDEFIDNAGVIPEMNEKYGYRNWFLVQDGATPHTASDTMDYLKTYCNVLEDWPSNSPDFNPIENIWGIIKRRVEELQPQSVDDLIKITFETWENVSIQDIQTLISSVPNRLSACINANGMHSGY